MTNPAIWAGVDLGQTTSHVCIVDDAGLTIHEDSCETSPERISQVLTFADAACLKLIAVESGSEQHIVRKLRSAGFPIAIFEARKASRFLAIRRNKSDASDARGLADLARLGRHSVSQVHLKSLECQQLRSQLAIRQRLVRVRVATEGAIRSRLALFGRKLRIQSSPTLLGERVAAEIEQLKAEEGIDLAEDLEPLVDVARSLRRYIDQVDKRLQKTAKSHPICQKLMSVVGVGPICSLSFYSAIEDPDRFKRAEEVAAYLGLIPRRYQSGDVSYTRGITKTGSTMTRTHLVNAALVFAAKGPDSALKSWASALRERAGARRARVALARKLSVILLKMWKTGAAFEPYPSAKYLTGRRHADRTPFLPEGWGTQFDMSEPVRGLSLCMIYSRSKWAVVCKHFAPVALTCVSRALASTCARLKTEASLSQPVWGLWLEGSCYATPRSQFASQLWPIPVQRNRWAATIPHSKTASSLPAQTCKPARTGSSSLSR